MMEESTILNLFDSITSNKPMRQKLLEILNQPAPPDSNVEHPEDSGSQLGLTQPPQSESPSAQDDPPSQGGDQLDANGRQLGINSSLEANAHQSRGVSTLEANVHQLSANPLVAGEHQVNLRTSEPVVGTSATFDPSSLSSVFDPNSLSISDEFTFSTHEVINQYLETHFCSSLKKDVRSAMNKHPVPSTSVMSVPKVDNCVGSFKTAFS